MRGNVKIVCVGGGPAGLYFATLVKLRDPGRRISVVERNPAGVTYGWGVVYWDDLLESLHHNDMAELSYAQIASSEAKRSRSSTSSNVIFPWSPAS